MSGTTQVSKTPRPSTQELLNLAARLDTMADACTKYGMTQNYLNSAAQNLRSAVGHAMKELQDEEIVVEVDGGSDD